MGLLGSCGGRGVEWLGGGVGKARLPMVRELEADRLGLGHMNGRNGHFCGPGGTWEGRGGRGLESPLGRGRGRCRPGGDLHWAV
jgi:hypothetical protein